LPGFDVLMVYETSKVVVIEALKMINGKKHKMIGSPGH